MTRSSRPPLLVSFSGIDGAGKSTQIELLHTRLAQNGSTVLRLTLWDNISVLPRLREGAMGKTFGGDRGVGSPEKPVLRRDKNVRRWYLTAGRCLLYTLDALHLIAVLGRAKRESKVDVIICDRYSYDELATLPLDNGMVRAYARALVRIIPQPDVALLLDADAETAVNRKPEYPLDFVRQYRRAYLAVKDLAGSITVIDSADVDTTHRVIWAQLQRFRDIQSRPLPAELETERAL